jgi:hypothetical protein
VRFFFSPEYVDSIKKLPRPGDDTVVNKFRDACEGFIDPECHVPCHACKNADEKKNGRREETQDRYRLENIENRHHEIPRPFICCGDIAVEECKAQGKKIGAPG